MIGIASQIVDRLVVLHLQMLRLINGSRSSVGCRRLRLPSSACPPPAELRERFRALRVPRVYLARRASRKERRQWRFHFQSPLPQGLPENDLARGSAWTHGEPGEHPAVIVLHGWMMSHFRSLYPAASAFFHAGCDVYFLELPHHMHRKQPGTYSGECFFGSKGECGVRSLLQSVFDTAAFLRWLRHQGTPGVALYGVSLGGTVGLTCSCYSAEADLVIAVAPACCLNELPTRSLLVRKLLKPVSRSAESLALEAVDPWYLKPLLPPDRLLFVVGKKDLIVPSALAVRLAERWGNVRVLAYRLGHITLNAARKVRQDVVRIAAQRLQEVLQAKEASVA
ncbi:MAG: hypothetical protein ONB23_00435 [candidate division KSB1 bacterium]|nr:hypothetical protein [candidate division KSB1 bacterium]